ncbi:MAG TPA: SDR family NAD(P)-dependent oxidoreductase, partial [Xanthobacteraceae bacterium]
MKLKNQVAIVTGAGRNIGRGIALALADGGAAVVVNARSNLEVAQAVAEEIARAGGKALAVTADVADAAAVDAAAEAAARELGPADVLVTSAGLIPNTEAIMDMDLAAHDRMWRVNYDGTVHACRSFGRQMIARKRGAIVTLGS